MKKILIAIVVFASLLTFASAYNPPAGSESMFEYSSPNALAGRQTVTGGALFSAGADSLVINPALTAGEQRVNLNAGYTFLFSTKEFNKSQIGNAFQTGIMIPFRMFIFSGYINGTFIPFYEMNLNNSMNFKVGLAKEITPKLDVGASLSSGVSWGNEADWSLGANLGFVYNFGDLAFFKDFRVGASVLNLGKNYKTDNSIGFKSSKPLSSFPTICTLVAGVGTSVFRNDMIDIGLALDLSTPLFQNLIVDFNSQIAIKDMFFISIGEKINLAESINDNWSAIPSVGVSFKFNFGIKNNQYLDRNGWSENEMKVSTAYKNLYNTVNAISAGVDVNLGLEDKSAPVIKFLDEEE